MDKQAGSTSVRDYRPALAQRLGLLLLFAGAMPVVNAQIAQTPASEEQRRHQLQAPDVVLPGTAQLDAVSPLAVPAELHCSTLHRFAPYVPRQLSRARQLDGASDFPFDPLRFPRYFDCRR